MGSIIVMADIVTPEERSQIMSKVKKSGKKSTELKLIKYFKEYGIKGWRRNYPLSGNPDFVLPKSRLAIFVDGCFWHGCKDHCHLPASNREYWIAKIDGNVKRDQEVTRNLEAKKWIVVRIWEHELKKSCYKKTLEKIKDTVDDRSQSDCKFHN
jgi:DNA mismatch endonuclease, patch repair protein